MATGGNSSRGFIPTKLYYRIGEVCAIVGVEPHVLRYWETEFPRLQPPKNKAGQRTYRPKDIELLLRIRALLYDEGYTIAGARKQLTGNAAGHDGLANAATAAHPLTAPRDNRLKEVRKELERILTLLNRG